MIYYIIIHVLAGLYACGIEEYKMQTKYRIIYNDKPTIRVLNALLYGLCLLGGPVMLFVSAFYNRSLKIALPYPKYMKWDWTSQTWKYECEFNGITAIKEINDRNQALFELQHSLDKSKADELLKNFNRLLEDEVLDKNL